MEKTKSSSFIQQHLANERTYLAWIRTAIAMIGIGFLVINIHFNFLPNHVAAANILANATGGLAVLSGILVIIVATYSYFAKMKTIDSGTFKPEKWNIVVLSFIIIVTVLILSLYLIHSFS